MALRPPPLDARPSILADWVELRTLAAPSGVFDLHKLKRFWDTSRESEGADSEGHHIPEEDTEFEGASGGDEDAFFAALIGALEKRADILQSSYPFEFSGAGKMRFRLVEPLSGGRVVYLFCLLLSTYRGSEFLDGSWNPDVTSETRDLFQACSTLAAAGWLPGCAISFGWPRPNANPPFLVRLKEVYARFGDGEVRTTPLPGTSPFVKDEEIDVIAWKPRPDNVVGTLYLLAQVASGENWEAKSIKGSPIEAFHRNWFSKMPASQPTSGIFIPFEPTTTWATREEYFDLHTVKYGMIFDRLILPFFAEEGLRRANDPNNSDLIERKDDFPAVEKWVKSQAETLKATNSLPL